jgi:hypothetical protein
MEQWYLTVDDFEQMLPTVAPLTLTVAKTP